MATVTALLRNTWRLAVPGGLILAAALVMPRFAPQTDVVATLAAAYPYFAVVCGLVLGLSFGQSRLVLAVATLAAADQALARFDGEPTTSAAIAVLVPVGLGLLALLPEPGLTSPGSAVRLGSLAAGGAAILFVRQPEQAARAAGLVRDWSPAAPYATWTALPHLALAAFAAAAALLGIRFLIRRDTLDAGFFWALAASLLAFHVHDPGGRTTTLLATAVLILGVAVIERSHALAYRDALTGLPGRRALEECLAQLHGRFAVAMVDIDHFKRVNDRHGHATGDQVLRMVASNLARSPGGAKAFRYGGEEFALVFRKASAAEAGRYLDDLRQSIAAARFTLRGADRPRRKPPKGKSRSPRGGAAKQLRVTVSIGVAERATGKSDPTDVLRAADKALYRAKGGGRNQVRAA